ncbi:MAG: hypothetical protein GKR98_00350 [Boseongicola sp.]|nr:MAG: hypothetical protein GKR98_00350 [Boseongicola sp.]
MSSPASDAGISVHGIRAYPGFVVAQSCDHENAFNRSAPNLSGTRGGYPEDRSNFARIMTTYIC